MISTVGAAKGADTAAALGSLVGRQALPVCLGRGRRVGKFKHVFCSAKCRSWPITSDIALQHNIGFLGYCVRDWSALETARIKFL